MSPKPPMWVIRVYQDRDTDPNTYEDYPFTPGKFLLSETILVEDQCNLTWPQVITGVGAWRSSALRGVIWILRKRSNPKLKLHEVELNTGDIQVLDPDELPEYGYVAPADLEPEVTTEAPKGHSSTEPDEPMPEKGPEESPGEESTNDAGPR